MLNIPVSESSGDLLAQNERRGGLLCSRMINNHGPKGAPAVPRRRIVHAMVYLKKRPHDRKVSTYLSHEESPPTQPSSIRPLIATPLFPLSTLTQRSHHLWLSTTSLTIPPFWLNRI